MVSIFNRVIHVRRMAIRRLDGGHDLVIFVGDKEWQEIMDYDDAQFKWTVEDRFYFASSLIERVKKESYLGYGVRYGYDS